MRGLFAMVLAAPLMIAVPALADGPLATAAGAQAAAPQPQTPAPPLQSAYPGGPGGAPVGMGPCGPEKVKPDGTLEAAPHGEVEAGAGTRGYRHLAGAFCQPLKDGGSVSVGVSADQWGGRR